MSLALTVLGSSATFATVERACAGYLVEVDGRKLWLDAGPGTWRNLMGCCDYREIDGVVLTHRHPDHTSDVFMGYHARIYGGPEPLPPIPLWAPAEALERLTGYVRELPEAFDLKEIAPGEVIEAAGAKCSFVGMAHPPVTLGVRIEHGAGVIAYSADTGPDADFHALASDADLFLCEATFQEADEPWEGHLSASQAARVSAEAGAKRLLLTHLPPGRDHGLSLEQALSVNARADIELVHDGARYQVTA